MENQPSSHIVYRWSHDVNTSDAEIVGPVKSVDECIKIATSDTEQKPIQRGDMELDLVKLCIRQGMFIKIMKKKTDGAAADEKEEGEVKEEDVYYTVFFPAMDCKECGQQFSTIFLSERECVSDEAEFVQAFFPLLRIRRPIGRGAG